MDLMGKTDKDVQSTMSGFQFSAIGMDSLESSEYTLVNILVDETGSVTGFQDNLEQSISQIVDACKKSPRSENLLLRVASFSNKGRGSLTVREIHGFNLLSNIKADAYKGTISPDGMTPLLDATLDSIETLEAQAKNLVSQDYLCNGVFYVITDGGENHSNNATYVKINDALARIRKEENLESIQSFLIGVNDTQCQSELDDFKTRAGFDNFISIGDATPGKLAKLAKWVSQSISSTSQAIGTGSVSQPVAVPSFTI